MNEGRSSIRVPRRRHASGRRSPSVTRRMVAVGVVALASVAAFWPFRPEMVEQHFSRGVYPRVQTVMTWLSNACTFSWLDVAVAGMAATVLFLLGKAARDVRTDRWRAVLALGWSLVVFAAAMYVLFAGLWGLNYQRVPLRAQLAFEPERVTNKALAAFAARAVGEINDLSARRSQSTPSGAGLIAVAERLAPAFQDVVAALGLPPVRAARPKVPRLTTYFNATGVSGMTNPLGLETLVASNLLDCERPLVVAHEWAHLAGIGPESEATLTGFLVCMRSGQDDRYSAWLDVALRALGVLPHEQRRTLVARLDPRVVADIRAMADRTGRDRVAWLSLAAWNIYDGYLKVNRVPEGVRSYDEVVALLVGTRFDEHWVPALRSASGPGSSRR